MKEPLFNWLESLGLTITPAIGTSIILAIILFTALAIHMALHHGLLPVIDRQTGRNGHWLHTALFKNKLFSRLVLTFQGVVLFVQARLWLDAGSGALEIIEVFTHLWILVFVLLSLFSLFDTLSTLLDRLPATRKFPTRGIMQSLKLIAAFLMVIFAISLLIGKSPLLLFSGLGAMSAVLMLVFKDPILGLVAGIQLSANNMLAVGDWLEMPKYGADGDVIDISLTTVKVCNWDKTVTTVPTYALISDSFKNWRGMTEAGGRRIKRSVFIDATSVHFLDAEDISRLRRAQLLSEYIETRLADIEADNSAHAVDPSSPVNGRRLTNLGTFRAYLTAYIRANKSIHKDMTQMVRQLDSGSNGIPLEIYAFTNNTAWVAYEGIQADIFDHIFAVLPEFGLRLYQNPTGHDMRSMIANIPQPQAE
jgi:miniconductance mechanosensitive channel